jgi:hypothetical protein
MTFSRNDLPLLGVTWRKFPTLADAKRFASFAERETRHDEYPCEAFVNVDERNEPGERFEVKVRNW